MNFEKIEVFYKAWKWLIITLILLLTLPLFFLWLHEFKYAEKDLNFTIEGIAYHVENYEDFQEVELNYSGTVQLNEVLGDDMMLKGVIEFEGESYPVNLTIEGMVDYIYLYRLDGSYFGTLATTREFERMQLYKVSSDNKEEVENCNSYFVFSKQGVTEVKNQLQERLNNR